MILHLMIVLFSMLFPQFINRDYSINGYFGYKNKVSWSTRLTLMLMYICSLYIPNAANLILIVMTFITHIIALVLVYTLSIIDRSNGVYITHLGTTIVSALPMLLLDTHESIMCFTLHIMFMWQFYYRNMFLERYTNCYSFPDGTTINVHKDEEYLYVSERTMGMPETTTHPITTTEFYLDRCDVTVYLNDNGHIDTYAFPWCSIFDKIGI